MRVRKVDLDVIKRYESSQVKFKTTGTMREVQFSAGVNKSCAIQNISQDTYPGKTAGKMKERKHNTNRYQYIPAKSFLWEDGTICCGNISSLFNK